MLSYGVILESVCRRIEPEEVQVSGGSGARFSAGGDAVERVDG
jgi:hypothetical protein